MLKLSKKGLTLPASPIRKLVPYADAAKKRGTKVYHLNIGQPDIAPPQIALDAFSKGDIKAIEYTHSAGLESYRRKLAEKYYASVGIDIAYDEILVTVGGSEAIIMAMTVCIDPDEEILCPEPYYANYNGFAIQSGINIKPISATIENDFALPSIDEFEKLIGPKTRGILICNPNNPTGYIYSEQELNTLACIVKKHNLYLIVDEVYREFCYDGNKAFSALNLKGMDDNVIVVDSVSKRYSMCGARLGALITRNKKVLGAAMHMAQARLSPPLLAQVAAEAAIDAPQSYFDDVIAEYVARRNCIVEEFNKIEGVYCPMPKGAFYTIAKLPIDDSERFAQWLLEEFSVDGQTVMVAPATGFYANRELGRQQIRIAYVLKQADLIAAARCLDEALKVYPGRTLK